MKEPASSRAAARVGARERPGTPPPTVRVLGVPFSAVSYEEAVGRIQAMVLGGEAHQVVIANAHTLNLAHADAAYRRLLQNASLVLRDGIGIELAAALAGRPLRYNFIGTDFIPRLLGEISVSVFLYGSAPGVADAAAGVLASRNAGLRVLGVEHGYVDRERVVGRIAAAAPDVLLVALGNPLQEQWIAANLPRLNARVAVGVGALFDNLAGRVPRAPAWLRRMRGEWVFRLWLEPRRMWRRYVVGNPVFLWRVATSFRRDRAA